MKRLSKTFYLGSYIGTIIPLSILQLVVYVGYFKYTDFRGLIHGFSYTDEFEIPWWSTLSSTLVTPIMIYFAVVLCMFIYNSWASIQDRHARTSPCRALGFLFIPFFNLYWIFQAIWGFAVDFNKYVIRNKVGTAPRLPQRWFLAPCILYLLSFILGSIIALLGYGPYAYAGWAVSTAYYIIGAILINKVCDAVNALPSNTKLNLGVAQRNC